MTTYSGDITDLLSEDNPVRKKFRSITVSGLWDHRNGMAKELWDELCKHRKETIVRSFLAKTNRP